MAYFYILKKLSKSFIFKDIFVIKLGKIKFFFLKKSQARLAHQKKVNTRIHRKYQIIPLKN